MRKRSSTKKRDVNRLAASIVQEVTLSAKEEPAKNPAAVALGRRGGLKGGKARSESLSSEQRSEIAVKAAQARWSKRRKGNG